MSITKEQLEAKYKNKYIKSGNRYMYVTNIQFDNWCILEGAGFEYDYGYACYDICYSYTIFVDISDHLNKITIITKETFDKVFEDVIEHIRNVFGKELNKQYTN